MIIEIYLFVPLSLFLSLCVSCFLSHIRRFFLHNRILSDLFRTGGLPTLNTSLHLSLSGLSGPCCIHLQLGRLIVCSDRSRPISSSAPAVVWSLATSPTSSSLSRTMALGHALSPPPSFSSVLRYHADRTTEVSGFGVEGPLHLHFFASSIPGLSSSPSFGLTLPHWPNR